MEKLTSQDRWSIEWALEEYIAHIKRREKHKEEQYREPVEYYQKILTKIKNKNVFISETDNQPEIQTEQEEQGDSTRV